MLLFSLFSTFLFLSVHLSILLSPVICLSCGSLPLYLFTYSFWLPVQRQVWLQYGAAHSKQATGHCGERRRHGLPPSSRSCADGQLHRTRLHNWGHRHLSGKVCQKLTTLGLCTKKMCPAGALICYITNYCSAVSLDRRHRHTEEAQHTMWKLSGTL